MPTSFLDLPREIRDIVYEHALVSPTGYVTPVENKSSRSLRWSLCAVSVVGDFVIHGTSTTHKEEFIVEDAIFKLRKNGIVSLSLPRTCRQICEETRHIALSNNIFAFNNVPVMSHALKSMGQASSRLITSVQFRFTYRHYKPLPKAFALLKSRARHGCFQKLNLVIPGRDFQYLINSKHYTNTTYDDVLEVLREGSKESNFQRTMTVYSGGVNPMGELEASAVRDLHLAFGGSMIYNGKLEWNDYEHVGNHLETP